MKYVISPVKFVFLAILCLLLFLPACKTVSKVNFQTLKAPQIILPVDISRFVFVDRNLKFSSDSVNHYYKIDGTLKEDKIDYTTQMSLSCYEGFRENISEYLQQDSIPFVKLPQTVVKDTLQSTKPLNWTRVDSICTKTNSDVLVVMENIQVFVEHEIVRSDTYWAFTEIKYVGNIRIYDPLEKIIYGERILEDSLFLESEALSLDRLIYQEIPDRDQLLNDAAYELGRTYVDLISPKWVDVSRMYFVSGDKRLSAALCFMNKNEFDSAINIWKSLINENDLKLAGRAAYNLAVVHEMKGDLKNARGWIRKAIYFYKKIKNRPREYKEIEAYSLVLNSRWVNGKKIKKFFGE